MSRFWSLSHNNLVAFRAIPHPRSSPPPPALCGHFCSTMFYFLFQVHMHQRQIYENVFLNSRMNGNKQVQLIFAHRAKFCWVSVWHWNLQSAGHGRTFFFRFGQNGAKCKSDRHWCAKKFKSNEKHETCILPETVKDIGVFTPSARVRIGHKICGNCLHWVNQQVCSHRNRCQFSSLFDKVTTTWCQSAPLRFVHFSCFQKEEKWWDCGERIATSPAVTSLWAFCCWNGCWFALSVRDSDLSEIQKSVLHSVWIRMWSLKSSWSKSERRRCQCDHMVMKRGRKKGIVFPLNSWGLSTWK